MRNYLLAAIAGAALLGQAAVAQTAPDPMALASVGAQAQQPSSQKEMDVRNGSILTGILGTEPLFENRLDVVTQLDVSLGKNNVSTNTITGRDANGSGGPTIGNSIGAATQFNAQFGNHNGAFNNAGVNFYSAGSVPAPLAGLISNDVFVGTQFNAQLGYDNQAHNNIDVTRSRNAN